jgi:hypothetical protein
MHTETGAAGEVIGLETLSQKIEQWRSQKPRTRAMPEELWEQASEAARSFGVGRVSKALRLGYAPCGDAAAQRERGASPADGSTRGRWRGSGGGSGRP